MWNVNRLVNRGRREVVPPLVRGVTATISTTTMTTISFAVCSKQKTRLLKLNHSARSKRSTTRFRNPSIISRYNRDRSHINVNICLCCCRFHYPFLLLLRFFRCSLSFSWAQASIKPHMNGGERRDFFPRSPSGFIALSISPARAAKWSYPFSLGGVSDSAACLADIKSVDWIRFWRGLYIYTHNIYSGADRCA